MGAQLRGKRRVKDSMLTGLTLGQQINQFGRGGTGLKVQGKRDLRARTFIDNPYDPNKPVGA
jgi:hypothetical protein